jgi:hypothetical protein
VDAVKAKRRPTPDEVAFMDTYRQLHRRHGLSWANGLSGAALGVPVGADTVYAIMEKESPDVKDIEPTII